MENDGYEVEEQGDEHHDVYVKKPYMVVELHKNLSDEKVEREIPEIDEWLENPTRKESISSMIDTLKRTVNTRRDRKYVWDIRSFEIEKELGYKIEIVNG